MKKHRDLEGELLLQIRAAGLPEPERQQRVSLEMHGGFKWDFYWPSRWNGCMMTHDRDQDSLAVEVMGDIYGGGHVRPGQYQRDCDKANAGVLLGIRVLRVTTADVDSGKGLETIAEALGRPLPPRRPRIALAARKRLKAKWRVGVSSGAQARVQAARPKPRPGLEGLPERVRKRIK